MCREGSGAETRAEVNVEKRQGTSSRSEWQGPGILISDQSLQGGGKDSAYDILAWQSDVELRDAVSRYSEEHRCFPVRV